MSALAQTHDWFPRGGSEILGIRVIDFCRNCDNLGINERLLLLLRTSVLNLENSPHQQLTGELIGENISPVRVGEL